MLHGFEEDVLPCAKRAIEARGADAHSLPEICQGGQHVPLRQKTSSAALGGASLSNPRAGRAGPRLAGLHGFWTVMASQTQLILSCG